jgi:transcriptional regulator with XRE-family HTH domain
MNAPQIIRTARIIHGLTQVQLAQRAGTSQPVISAYENGLRDPSIDSIRSSGARVGIAEVLRWVGRTLGEDDPFNTAGTARQGSLLLELAGLQSQ